MNFLKTLLGRNSKPVENAQFSLFKGASPKGTDFSDSAVFYIHTFENTDENWAVFEKYKFSPDLAKVLPELGYNIMKDAIGVHYVVPNVGKSRVYLMHDPYELFEKEYIIAQYDWVFDEKIMALPSVSRIH